MCSEWRNNNEDLYGKLNPDLASLRVVIGFLNSFEPVYTAPKYGHRCVYGCRGAVNSFPLDNKLTFRWRHLQVLFNENDRISILKFVPKGPFDNKSALV